MLRPDATQEGQGPQSLPVFEKRLCTYVGTLGTHSTRYTALRLWCVSVRRKKGRKEERKKGRKEERKKGRKEERKKGRKEERKKGRKEERKKGRKEERKKGRKEERKKGRKEERKKGRKEERKKERVVAIWLKPSGSCHLAQEERGKPSFAC